MSANNPMQEVLPLMPRGGGSSPPGWGAVVLVAGVVLLGLAAVAWLSWPSRLLGRVWRRVQALFKVVGALVDGVLTLLTLLVGLLALLIWVLAAIVEGLQRIGRWGARHPFLTALLGLTGATVVLGLAAALVTAGGAAVLATSIWSLGQAAWGWVLAGVVAVAGWVVQTRSALGGVFRREPAEGAGPGGWMFAIADFFCTRGKMEGVVKPLLADLRCEYTEAVREGRTWKARWIRVSYVWHFFNALGPASLWDLVRRLVDAALHLGA